MSVMSVTFSCLAVSEEKRASPNDGSLDLSYTQPILGLDDSLSRGVFFSTLTIQTLDIQHKHGCLILINVRQGRLISPTVSLSPRFAVTIADLTLHSIFIESQNSLGWKGPLKVI